MNAKIRIFVDTATLKSTGAGGTNIDGCIGVNVDGVWFPCERWFDYPGTILTWWLASTADLAGKKVKKADWLFMDGPCYFRLTRITGNSKQWRLRFFPSEGRKTSLDLKLNVKDVLFALAKAAQSMRSYCQRNRLQCWSDLPQLESGLDRIKTLTRRNAQVLPLR